MVLLTHYDLDHMGGLLGLGARYGIETLVVPPGEPPELWRAPWEALVGRAQSVRLATAGGWAVYGDGVAIKFLHPFGLAQVGQASDNDVSPVLRLTYGWASFLFTGDLGTGGEQTLLEMGMLKPTWVLKVSHHGSQHGTGAKFLAAISPALAVVSVGPNRYGHPAEAVLQRLAGAGATCLRTDQLGTVEIVTDGTYYALNTGL